MKHDIKLEQCPFDMGVMIDLIVSSMPSGTMFNQGKSVGLTTAMTNSVYQRLFTDVPDIHVDAMSDIISVFSAGKLDEKLRDRGETSEDVIRWPVGMKLTRRHSDSRQRRTVLRNLGAGIIDIGTEKNPNYVYAHEFMPADSAIFFRDQEALVDIELSGFPLSQTFVENLLVMALGEFYGAYRIQSYGYLKRYATIDENGRVQQGNCEDQISKWVQRIINHHIKNGKVMVQTENNSVYQATSFGGRTFTITNGSNGKGRAATTDIKAIWFLDGGK